MYRFCMHWIKIIIRSALCALCVANALTVSRSLLMLMIRSTVFRIFTSKLEWTGLALITLYLLFSGSLLLVVEHVEKPLFQRRYATKRY